MSRTFRVVVVRDRPSPDDLTAAGVARALRQAGFEVIMTPPSATSEQAAEATLQEDVDAVVLVGNDDAAAPDGPVVDALATALAALGLDDVAVVTGTSPADVVARLERVLGADPPGLGADADS